MSDDFSPQFVTLAPGQTVDLAPGQQVDLAPGQTVNLAPGQAVNLNPGQQVVLAPGQTVTLSPGQTVNLAPGQTVNLSPGQQVIVPVNPHTGPDGTVVLDGTVTVPWATKAGSVYTQTRDIFLTSLTVAAGVTLLPAGFRIFTGTLNVVGTISANGSTGGLTAGGAGGGALSFYGPGQTGANAGVRAAATTNSLGGQGGGTGSLGQTPPGALVGGIPRDKTTMMRPNLSGLAAQGTSPGAYYTGGVGGNGGAASGTGEGGGGGGGGIIAIFADTVTISGSITANGGDGFPGSTAEGGGGGTIFIYYAVSLTVSGTISVNGGNGNSGSGHVGNIIETSFAI